MSSNTVKLFLNCFFYFSSFKSDHLTALVHLLAYKNDFMLLDDVAVCRQ